MSFLAYAFILAGLFAFVLAAVLRTRSRRRLVKTEEACCSVQDVFEEVAQRLGLSFREEKPEAVGRVRGFDVIIDDLVEKDDVENQNARTATRIVLKSNGALPRRFAIGREGLEISIKKLFDVQDISIADLFFEREVRLHGDDVDTVSRLNDNTRPKVLEFLELSGVIEQGDLLWAPGKAIRDVDRLENMTRRMVTLADDLSGSQVPSAIAERLVKNIKLEPLPQVRFLNLQLIVEFFADDPAAQKAAQIAMSDSEPHVRMLGALMAGGRGSSVLMDDVLNERGALKLRLNAIDHLARGLPRDEAVAFLHEVIDRSDLESRCLAVRGLGRLKHAESLDVIQNLVTKKAPDKMKTAVAEALGGLGTAKAESMLLTLFCEHNDDVRLAAARSLGWVGTLAAIEMLDEHRQGPVRNPAIKTAARVAIGRIQARHNNEGNGE